MSVQTLESRPTLLRYLPGHVVDIDVPLAYLHERNNEISLRALIKELAPAPRPTSREPEGARDTPNVTAVPSLVDPSSVSSTSEAAGASLQQQMPPPRAAPAPPPALSSGVFDSSFLQVTSQSLCLGPHFN